MGILEFMSRSPILTGFILVVCFLFFVVLCISICDVVSNICDTKHKGMRHEDDIDTEYPL